jgi:hypothetical protein
MRTAVRGRRKVAESEMQLGCAPPFTVMAGLVPRLSGWSFRRRRRRGLPPPLWGRAGEGGRANLTECGSLGRFGEVGATPLPNPPPQGGRESPHSTRCSNPSLQRRQLCQSSAISGLSKLRGFPQPDSRGLVPAIPRRMRSIRPHAAPLRTTIDVGGGFWAWMPGTRPGMTCCDSRTRSTATGFCSPNSDASPKNRLRTSDARRRGL